MTSTVEGRPSATTLAYRNRRDRRGAGADFAAPRFRRACSSLGSCTRIRRGSSPSPCSESSFPSPVDPHRGPSRCFHCESRGASDARDPPLRARSADHRPDGRAAGGRTWCWSASAAVALPRIRAPSAQPLLLCAPSMSLDEELMTRLREIEKGGAPRYHQKNQEQGKLFARERIRLLVDSAESFVEDGKLANNRDPELPADGVITGTGKVHGRPVAIMANDSTVKAGSWGARTVEKILRIQETARGLQIPLFYLVDSAGARITDQVEMFPGRRGAGRIFYNQVQMSGQVPQICLLFGPSAAGGAYIPAFCDIVVMVEGNASMYLGSPRMAEMVIGEKVTLEELGGARM